MNKFGLLECSWGKKFVEYSPSRGIIWIHSSSEPIIANLDKIDFNMDHIIDYLLTEGKYSWGTYLPQEIINKLKENINKLSEWHVNHLNYLERELNYSPVYPNKK